LTVSLNYKNKEWLRDFLPLRNKMQDVKLAFMANKVKNLSRKAHGEKTGI